MGGDQLDQLISEYLKQNGGFIAFMIVLASLCVIAIIAGIVLHFIINRKQALLAYKGEATIVEEEKPIEKPKEVTPVHVDDGLYKFEEINHGKKWVVKSSDGKKVMTFDSKDEANNYAEYLNMKKANASK